jgi:hypothetical protein
MQDSFGQELHVGDTIAHVTKQSTAVNLKYGIITAITDTEAQAVMLTRRYEWRIREYKLHTYKTTVRTGNNMIKIDVPANIKQLLDHALQGV